MRVRRPATLADLARVTVPTVFVGAAVVLLGVVVLVSVLPSASWPVVVLMVLVLLVGVAVLAAGVAAFLAAERWRRRLRAGWTPLEVRVVPDEADEEVRRTLLDTTDGEWRLAILAWPLPLRDRASRSGTVEYVGDLREGKPVLLRPTGETGQWFAVPRRRAGLT